MHCVYRKSHNRQHKIEQYDMISLFNYSIHRPEDNDDLVEILDATAPKLRNYYGDFYIAEIVTKHEPNRSIIVAEVSIEIFNFNMIYL